MDIAVNVLSFSNFHLQTTEDLEVLVDQVKQEYIKYNRVFDFYITCTGPIADLQDIRIHIGNCHITTSSLAEAIDSLFQIVLSLKKDFPPAATPIWTFITKICYGLPSIHTTTSIIKLAAAVDRVIDDSVKNKTKRAAVNEIHQNKKKR